MYILKPYLQQAHLTKNNYAFRDYYKRAVGTHNTYLGGVIVSTATGKKEAVISVPIYSNNSKGFYQKPHGFAAQGAKVYVCDINKDALRALVADRPEKKKDNKYESRI